jgi:hypothetical protein
MRPKRTVCCRKKDDQSVSPLVKHMFSLHIQGHAFLFTIIQINSPFSYYNRTFLFLLFLPFPSFRNKSTIVSIFTMDESPPNCCDGAIEHETEVCLHIMLDEMSLSSPPLSTLYITLTELIHLYGHDSPRIFLQRKKYSSPSFLQ